jgi:hypothetical protein
MPPKRTPKRKLPEPPDQGGVGLVYFYLSKIPGQPDNDYSLDEYWDLKDLVDAKNVLLRGLAKLLVWCSVIGIRVNFLYRGSETSSSLILAVSPVMAEYIEKHLIGDHQGPNGKFTSATLLRFTFTSEKEILDAGKLV